MNKIKKSVIFVILIFANLLFSFSVFAYSEVSYVYLEESGYYSSDNGNYILDCEFERIENPVQLEQDINMIPGVVENGLFIGVATKVIVGSKKGIMTLERELTPTQ